MYVDGAFVDAENSDCYNSINPFNGEAIAKIPLASVGDVNKAVAAARNAFDHGPWPRMSGEERSEFIGKAAAILKDRMKEFNKLPPTQSHGTHSSVSWVNSGLRAELKKQKRLRKSLTDKAN